MSGLPAFTALSRELMFGKTSLAVTENRIATAQCISGTGSLRVGAEFLKMQINPPVVYVSNPTWGNHNTIFERAGIQVRSYPYWKPSTRGFDL